MKFTKAFNHALNMVLHSRLRSWLTILGIVIGIAAVIAIVSMSSSLESDISSQFDSLGADLLTVTAGSSSASFSMGPPGSGRNRDSGDNSASSDDDETVELTKTDLLALKTLNGIKTISPQISGTVDIYYVAESGDVQVTGVDAATWETIANIDLAEGRMLSVSDTNSVIIGGRLADGFFEKTLGINQQVTIEGSMFRIVGVIDDSSTSVYMPISVAYNIIEDAEQNVYDTIILQVEDEETLDEAINATEKKLRIARHVTEDTQDFSISSNQEAQDQRSEAMSSMTTFLTAIAAVALLVGAVGVANTMFTSVLEKTKEIGIMKAIGARNGDILKIFMINAALIGFIGGVLGIILGILLSGLLPSLMGESMRMFGNSGGVSVKIMLTGIGISVLLGVGSGIIPAVKASKLKPVDALRYD